MSETTQTEQPNQEAQTTETGTTPVQKPTSELPLNEQVDLATKALVAGADTSEFSEAVLLAANNKKEANELQQKLEAAETQRQEFQKKAEQVDPYTLLSDEQKQELESLQETDVQAYYAKRKEYEDEAKQKFTQAATQENTQSKLETAISLHNARNPGMPMSMETLEQDIPLRLKNDLTEKLNAGLITPADAVNAVAEFLSGSKKIGGTEQPTTVPNLSDTPGGATLPEQEQAQTSSDLVY